MQLTQADKYISFTKASLAIEGYKPSQKIVEDGLLMLLDKLPPSQKNAAALKLTERALKGSERERKSAKGSLLFFRSLTAAERLSGKTHNSEFITALHALLFEGLYESAGELRKTPLEYLGNEFTEAKYIPHSLAVLLKKMETVKASPEISKTEFVKLFTYYYQQLSLLAPFSYGNGLTLRLFLFLFAQKKGFGFAIKSPAALKEGEEAALSANNIIPLYEALSESFTYAVKSIMPPRPRIKKPPRTPQQIVKKEKEADKARKDTADDKTPVKKPIRKRPCKARAGQGVFTRLPALIPTHNVDEKTSSESISQPASKASAESFYQADKASKTVTSDSKSNAAPKSAVKKPIIKDTLEKETSHSSPKPQQSAAADEPLEIESGALSEDDSIDADEMVIYDYEIVTSTLPPEKRLNLDNAPYSLVKKAYRMQSKIEKLSRKLDDLLQNFRQ